MIPRKIKELAESILDHSRIDRSHLDPFDAEEGLKIVSATVEQMRMYGQLICAVADWVDENKVSAKTNKALDKNMSLIMLGLHQGQDGVIIICKFISELAKEEAKLN